MVARDAAHEAARQAAKEARRERRRKEGHRTKHPPVPLNTFWDQDDQEFIARKNMQRNQRRLHAMQERDETDDTLYEIPMRMPEVDFTRQTAIVA
ncbi:unnamed protein product [Nippostrongylus brasiliensis]|uniref:PRP21_like_P domain-containing protein n=1 Tax=Nippostrongylus brasiliensis TaxID=27835 RepID=A0A0N4YWN4_NIPBR|nr:unnamed protein product [Nippostrongylus brasiliensis]